MIPKRLRKVEDPAATAGGLKDELREKSKLLREEIDKLNATYGGSGKGHRRPLYLVAQNDTANKQVAELLKFKDDAQSLFIECRKKFVELDRTSAELRKLDTDTEALIDSLEDARAVYSTPDASGLDEDSNRRRGATRALRETIDFLRRRGVERQHCVPLVKLWHALEDVECGIRNPITALPNSKPDKGRRLVGNTEYHRKAKASWAVTGLGGLGVGAKKAYDIVADASGLPRDVLKRFRNDLTAPKRRGPKEAQLVYDLLEYCAPKSPNFDEFVEDVLDELRDMRNAL